MRIIQIDSEKELSGEPSFENQPNPEIAIALTILMDSDIILMNLILIRLKMKRT